MEIKKHCFNCYVEKYKIEYCENCFNKYVSKEQLENFINNNFLYAYQNENHILNIYLLGMRNKNKCVFYYSAWTKKDNVVDKLLDFNFIDFVEQKQQQLKLFEL